MEIRLKYFVSDIYAVQQDTQISLMTEFYLVHLVHTKSAHTACKKRS